MVTSYDMNESEMGYCGSKSEINKKLIQYKKISVKEQRADGSW